MNTSSKKRVIVISRGFLKRNLVALKRAMFFWLDDEGFLKSKCFIVSKFFFVLLFKLEKYSLDQIGYGEVRNTEKK